MGPYKDKQMQNPISGYKTFKKLLWEKQVEGAL
jgi:hypothetical protein